LTPSFERNPRTHGHKILSRKTRHLEAAHGKNCVILAFTILTQYSSVTDRQTERHRQIDRQMTRPWLRRAKHSATAHKKCLEHTSSYMTQKQKSLSDMGITSRLSQYRSFQGWLLQAKCTYITHNNGTVHLTFTENPNMKHKTQKQHKLNIRRTRHYNCAVCICKTEYVTGWGWSRLR